ncbi:hypothetical protein Pmani_035157 [Petrolisthes manimaculis]|uniref:Breast cancer anti-estrogen resistance protein 3 n=1 Tax=Petrolisthes manimaculis TaxID=1843537 RepID=A0AAE1NMV9_9EUCA|nr:hypothetical protein Pmani_035157 [Petrolisthes manimaculis]
MGNKAFSPSNDKKTKGSFMSSLRRGASQGRRMSWLPRRPHLDCRAWLATLHLTQYTHLFTHVDGVEDILYIDETAIKNLGIGNEGHRTKIMNSLTALRHKWEKNHKIKGCDANPRLSLVEQREPRTRPLPDPLLHPDVVLRNKHGTNRRDARKREAAILSPNTIVKMSFEPATMIEAGELRKLLEWELGLDSADLRSHAWYHGTIPRARAEEVVLRDGSFLIRDCISQPGDFVLTSHWNTQTLHFVIQKTIVQPNTVYERIQYQLEDDAYDTIPDLVRAYVGGRKPVTASSGARVINPVNRTAPLSFYASKYAVQTAHTVTHGTLSRPPVPKGSNEQSVSGGGMLRHQHSYSGPMGGGGGVGCTISSVGCTIVRSPAHSPPRVRRDTAPTLQFTKGRSISLSRTQEDNMDSERSCSNDGVVGPRPHTSDQTNKFTSQSLPRKMTTKAFSIATEHTHTHTQHTDAQHTQHTHTDAQHTHTHPDDQLKTSGGGDDPEPPPKPSRVPSFKVKPKKPPQMYHPPIPPQPQHPQHERIYAEIDEGDEDEGNNGRGGGVGGTGGDPKGTPQSSDDLKTPTEGDGVGGEEEEGGGVIDVVVVVGGAGGGAGGGSVGDNNTPRHSRLSEMYQPSGSDSGNGSGDSVQTSASDARNRDSQASFGDTGSVQLEEDSVVEEEPFNLPQLVSSSAFDLENFNTLLLNSLENKPLDATALKGVKNALLECGSRVLAAHLTKVDLDLLNGSTETDYGLGVTTGIELITLPHGGQLRADLIERTECLKLIVAVTIVMTPDPNERAEIINRWIQIAVDTKTAMGNLYGFAAIILGLCMPEIQRLTTTWHTLRQKFTDSAYNFESKLRSTLKAMNECSNPQAPNTTIPHLLPFILLCERDLNDIYAMHRHCSSILQWETTASDYGLQMLFSHLVEARAMTQNLTLYRRNADHIIPTTSSEQQQQQQHHHGALDELTLDMFRTEFHLKFLWGSKGALLSGSEERHAKFQEVLVKLSERCEPG